MELSSLLEMFLGSEIEKFLSSRKGLEIGDKLQGNVIEIKEDGKALIDFLKFRTIAKVKFPVKVGEKINVTVVEKGESVKFSLENRNSSISVNSKEIINSIKNQDFGDIKNLVESLNNLIPEKAQKSDITNNTTIEKKVAIKSDIVSNIKINDSDLKSEGKEIQYTNKAKEIPDTIKNVIKVLETQFKPFGPAEDILKISSRLKTQIENSGIFFEKKIETVLSKIDLVTDLINTKLKANINSEIKSIIQNDLKPNLLLLKEFFLEEFKEAGSKQKPLGLIRDTIEDLINNISKQQDGAVKRNQNLDPMHYFTFQIPLKDKKKAKLRVYYNKNENKKSSNKGFNLSLLLIMDNLGDIRADFFLLKKDLNITIFVMDEDIKKKISDKIGVVRESLVNVFRFLNVNVIVSKRKIRDFENEEIVGEEIKMGLVDLSV